MWEQDLQSKVAGECVPEAPRQPDDSAACDRALFRPRDARDRLVLSTHTHRPPPSIAPVVLASPASSRLAVLSRPHRRGSVLGWFPRRLRPPPPASPATLPPSRSRPPSSLQPVRTGPGSAISVPAQYQFRVPTLGQRPSPADSPAKGSAGDSALAGGDVLPGRRSGFVASCTSPRRASSDKSSHPRRGDIRWVENGCGLWVVLRVPRPSQGCSWCTKPGREGSRAVGGVAFCVVCRQANAIVCSDHCMYDLVPCLLEIARRPPNGCSATTRCSSKRPTSPGGPLRSSSSLISASGP